MLLRVPSWKRHNGYTLLEMLVVVGIIIVGSGIAIPVTMKMVQNAKGDSALIMTSTFLQTARNRAVAERRNIVVSFPSTTTIQAERIEVPSGVFTLVDSMTLEGEQEFVKVVTTDTPDRYGNAAAINFSGTTPVMFTSDGSLIDAAGDVTNGTVFLAKPDDATTARAVSITGVTGLMRVWKWGGSEWMQ